MKKFSIIALVFIICIGLLIFFNGEIGTTTEEARISILGGFSAENDDFAFSMLSVLDEEGDNIVDVDLTHDIRKSLTKSLIRQHAEKNPSPEHPTTFIGSLTFTDNNGRFTEIQFYEDESNHTYINFPSNFESKDNFHELTTDHFPDLFLK